LLQGKDADYARGLLKTYLQERIAFYVAHGAAKLERIAADTARLQDQMSTAVATSASAQPSPLNALAVAGMNNVIDSEGYTHAAWLYRVPEAAWVFMQAMAVVCTLLFGYRFRGTGRATLLILPIITVLSFFVISDIDNPRRGVIQVVPQNLILTEHAVNLQPPSLLAALVLAGLPAGGWLGTSKASEASWARRPWPRSKLYWPAKATAPGSLLRRQLRSLFANAWKRLG
jgi:hypothetical protein